MVTYYAVAALLTFFCLILFIFTFEPKKVNYYWLIVVMIMAIANSGYLVIALSETVSEAVMGNRLSYLGGCFVPPVTLSAICIICNYKMKRWLRNLLYGFSFVVYIMVCTVGFNDIYYKEMWLEKYRDATILGHTYGVGHSLFYIILYGYMVGQIVVLAYSILRNSAVSRKILLTFLMMDGLNTILFIIGRFLNSPIEIIPLMYVIDSWIFFYMHYRGMLYNIEDSIISSVSMQESFGYIVVDNKYNFLGANDVAMKVMPEIRQCKVDKPILGADVILEWVKSYAAEEEALFSYENAEAHYECRVERLRYKGKARGYIIELREDTEKWKYLNLLSEHNLQLVDVQTQLKGKVDEQTEELVMQQQRIKELFLQTITALSEAVDAKDRYTSGHSKRVALYSRMIAERMGKSKEEQEEIYRAGLLHDVGKIRIPVEIINKPSKLTDEEYNIIKIHPVTGYHILRGISGSTMIAIAAKYHHERYDGKGYPNGLSGEKIPEVARILGIADSYDAMTSNRSYRKALPQDIVRAEIEKGKGTQFDPHIAEIMLQMIAEDKEYSMRQTDSMQRKILVVDDEAINNKLIAHIMQDEPMYEVIPAGGGREALALLKQTAFDLILLDVKMPEMDGLETLKLIREKYQTPVVLMTGDKTLDTSTEFAKYGCDDYITKPFLPLLIKEVIHNMTEKVHIE